MTISGVHLGIDIIQENVYARDLGSTGGTILGQNQRLEPNRQLNIRQGDHLSLAGALTLSMVLGRNEQQQLEWVRLDRIENTPEKSYVVLPGRLWLDPNSPHYCSTTTNQFEIRWMDKHAALCNASQASIEIRGTT